MALELENETQILLTRSEEEEEEVAAEVVEDEEEEVPLQGRRRRPPPHVPTSTGKGNGIDTSSIMSVMSLNPSAGFGSGSFLYEPEADPEAEPEAEEDPEAENEVLELKLNGNGNNTMVHDDAEQPQDVKGGGFEKISVHFDKETGTESTYGFSESSIFDENPGNQILYARETHLDAQSSLTAVTKSPTEESQKIVRLSSFNLLPPLKHGELEEISFEPSDNGMIHIEDTVPVEESDRELPELDIERVLSKQETHDLFCPNCNSCITRRVILRKRKRKIQDIHHKIKRDKVETILDSELVANSENLAHDTVDNSMEGSSALAANNNVEREPEIFRCLSCFSFFIPTGNDFKLFRIFRERNNNEEMPSLQQSAAIIKKEEIQNYQQSSTTINWFSIFASNKGKMAVKQGGAVKADSEVKFVKQSKSSLLSNDIQPQPESGHQVTSTVSGELVNAVKPAEDAISRPEQVGDETQLGQDGLASSIQGAALLVQSPPIRGFEKHDTFRPGNEEKIVGLASTQSSTLVKTTVTYTEERSYDAVEINKTGDAVWAHSEVKFTEQMNSSLGSNDIQPQHKSSHTVTSITSTSLVNAVNPAEDAILKPQQVGQETQPGQGWNASSFQGDDAITQTGNDKIYTAVASTVSPISLKTTVTHAGVSSDIAVEMDKTEDDFSLAEEEPVRAAISHGAQNIAASDETEPLLASEVQIYVGEQDVVPAETYGWDILKSIVYGGLIESITSLGVVTSAAGAGAATLNVIALGLANLIGGLFIIVHNLWELKNDRSEAASSQIEQVDRYNELLGRREKFTLHMVVAVLSYLVFGLIPPIVYGFSFRTSGDRDYKLAAVSAASLLCIILLALGKGHVRKPPKSYIKTLLYYASIAIMTSGVSYLVGVLLEKLLEKLGWLDSSFVVAAPFHDLRDTKPAWSSY